MIIFTFKYIAQTNQQNHMICCVISMALMDRLSPKNIILQDRGLVKSYHYNQCIIFYINNNVAMCDGCCSELRCYQDHSLSPGLLCYISTAELPREWVSVCVCACACACACACVCVCGVCTHKRVWMWAFVSKSSSVLFQNNGDVIMAADEYDGNSLMRSFRRRAATTNR